MANEHGAQVLQMDDERLIRDGEAAVDLYNKDLKNARARIMPMARGLCAAKRKYPATQDFGDWLTTSSYREIENDDRAALIKLGEHDDFATKFMRTTNLISPQTIWDAIKDLMSTSYDTKSTPVSTIPPETSPATAPAGENENQPAENNDPINPKSPAGRKSMLSALPRGDELAKMFVSKKPRALIGRICEGRKGKPILDLIHRALDAGLITPTTAEFNTPSLYLLFPLAPLSYARRFDLTNAKQREDVTENILPAMIACRDKLLMTPEDMLNILNTYMAEQQANRREEEAKNKRNEAIASLPTDQCQIIMYGTTLWPRMDNRQGEYDYDQVRAAVWTFRDLDNWNRQISGDNGVGSRGIRIRLSTKWYSEYLIRNNERGNPVRRIMTLIHYITRLMEAGPEAECKWPPYPTAEAEW